MMYLLIGIITAAGALLLVMILRAVVAKEHMPPFTISPPEWSDEIIIEHLSRMIQVKTDEPENLPAFRDLLGALYPNVTAHCERELAGNEIIYRWKGKSPAGCSVLMSHYDVVPADHESDWTHPPFSGAVADGKVWGRGALDTKCTLCAAMEAAEHLIDTGFVPEHDIYFCFGGDEETEGSGARAAVRLMKERGISPSFVLDEGGAVILGGHILGVHYPFALVGLAEKGYMDVEFIVRSDGGHTSVPPKVNPTTVMADVIRRINANPFEFKMNAMSKALIFAACKHASFGYRLVFANYWIFKRYVRHLIRKTGRELDALSRTTCAVTMLEGGPAPNMIPPKVRAVANFRIAYQSSVDETLDRLRSALSGLEVEMNVLTSEEPSKMSVLECEGFHKLESAITGTWGRTAVFPYLMMAGSDSRQFSDISDNVYRFSPIALNRDDMNSIHGLNESIECENFHKAVEFYKKLIKTL